MASIPLAALAVRPVEQPDLLGQYGKLVALKSMLQNQQYEQQMRPLQMQAEQNAIRQQNLQYQSEQGLMRAYNEANGDLDKFTQLAPKYGVLPKDALAAQNSLLERQDKIASLTGKTRDNANKQLETIGQVSSALLQKPTLQERVQALGEFAPVLHQAGIDVSQIPPEQLPQWLSDDHLKFYQTSSMKANEVLSQQRQEKQFTQEHGPLPDDKLSQINQALTSRYQVLNPGKPLPTTYQLSQGATVDDFNRIDKLMEQSEKAQATKAQRDTANAMRQESIALAQGNLALRQAEANKPSADQIRRNELSDGLQENLDQLKDIVQRRPDLFGKVAGRETAIRQWLGSNDPDVAALKNIKDNIGTLKLGTHAMRSASHIGDAADAVVHYENGADAILKSIQTAENSLNTFRNEIPKTMQGQYTGIQPKGGNPSPNSGPPAGATHIAPGSDGQMHYTNAQGQDLGIVRK